MHKPEFIELGPVAVYCGPWPNRPAYSVNLKRTLTLRFWRIFRRLPGVTRAGMIRLLLSKRR